MKLCPHCSTPIAILRIARCHNALKCRGCGRELCPDRRSQTLMFATLVAFFPVALYLARRITGHSFLFGVIVGLLFGMAAGGAGCLIYAWTVRLHENDHRPAPRSWGGLV